MLGRCVTALAICMALVSFHRPAPVAAQTATPAELATVALTSSDVPGFHVVSEESLSPSSSDADILTAGWARLMAADDAVGTGSAALGVYFFVPNPTMSTSALRSIVNRGWAYSELPGTVNLHLTGPLGIGDVDQPATWNTWDAENGTWSTVSADTFLHGRLLVMVAYATHRDVADPSTLACYVQLQEAKLFATAVVPAALVQTQASTTVASSSQAGCVSLATGGHVLRDNRTRLRGGVPYVEL